MLSDLDVIYKSPDDYTDISVMTYPNHPPPPPPQYMGSENTVFVTQYRFDLSYLKTVPGILKILVILLNLIGFICIQSSPFWSNGRGVYFNVVAHLGFWFSLVMLGLYAFHVVEKHHNVKWLKVELAACLLMVLLYLIAATVVVAYGATAYSAAGFFGYIAMVAYGVDAFLKARALKNGDLAQGQRVMTKPTHVTTPPALT